MSFIDGATEVPAETFAGAHPSGWRRLLPFTRSWVTTGLSPGSPLRRRLFTWILWYLSFIYSGCGAHLGAGAAKIHVVLCNHGVERMILQLYVRLPSRSSVLHALCNTLSIKILRFLKLSPHLPGGMFFHRTWQVNFVATYWLSTESLFYNPPSCPKLTWPRQELGLVRSGAAQFAAWVPPPAADVIWINRIHHT